MTSKRKSQRAAEDDARAVRHSAALGSAIEEGQLDDLLDAHEAACSQEHSQGGYDEEQDMGEGEDDEDLALHARDEGRELQDEQELQQQAEEAEELSIEVTDLIEDNAKDLQTWAAAEANRHEFVVQSLKEMLAEEEEEHHKMVAAMQVLARKHDEYLHRHSARMNMHQRELRRSQGYVRQLLIDMGIEVPQALLTQTSQA